MVNNIALSFILVLISILPTLSNSASAPPPGINLTDGIVLPAVDASIVIRQQQVEINRDQLSDDKVQTIQFDLFNDVSVTALLEKHSHTPDGGFVWQGYIVGYPGSTVVFVINGTRVSGEIIFSESLYQIRSLADGIYIAQEINKTISIRRDVGNKSKMTDDVITLTNQERAKYGIPALVYNTRVTQAAQGHAEDMAQNNYFSHTSQDGRNPGDRIKATGYPGTAVGENIAAGYSTAATVVDAWINSEGHHANMISEAGCEIGVGYAYIAASDYGHYWVQNFAHQSNCPAPPIEKAPDVVTGTATQVVGTDSVKLTGTVNPNGLNTTYYFEVGYTTAYGSTSSMFSVGSGTSPLSVQLTPSGFLFNTTYHYRVVAKNNMGTTYGNDVVFRTGGQNQGKLQIGSLLLLLL